MNILDSVGNCFYFDAKHFESGDWGRDQNFQQNFRPEGEEDFNRHFFVLVSVLP